jgi:hypothetical protein
LGKKDKNQFVMLYNVQKREAESLKYLKLPENCKICSATFGPMDNQYLLIGLSNGVLLGLEVPSLNISIQE